MYETFIPINMILTSDINLISEVGLSESVDGNAGELAGVETLGIPLISDINAIEGADVTESVEVPIEKHL